MSLPQIQPQDNGQGIGAVFTQMQTLWSAALNPIVNRAQNSSTILPKVQLVAGDNIIPHTLNRELQGWSVVRYRGSWAEIYDKQDANTKPASSLVLNASADVLIDLEVF